MFNRKNHITIVIGKIFQDSRFSHSDSKDPVNSHSFKALPNMKRGLASQQETLLSYSVFYFYLNGGSVSSISTK